MAKSYPPEERRKLAAKVSVNEQYLYQCLTGRREMGAQEAVRIEADSDRELRRWDVCSKTWHLIWPELIDADGAPPVPEAAAPPTQPEHSHAAG